GAVEQAVLGGVGNTLFEDKLVGRFQEDGTAGVPVEVPGYFRTVSVDRFDLGYNIEGSTTIEQNVGVRERLHFRAEARLGAADTLGDRPHLAVVLREQGDDPVVLSQL